MTIFKAIEMENYKDEPLQFVGVYVLRWRPEWGEPSIGFVTDDETESKLERLQRIEEAARKVLYDWEERQNHIGFIMASTMRELKKALEEK